MASTEAYNALKSAIQTGITPVPVLDFDQIDWDQQQGTDAFTVLEEVGELEDLVGFGANLCHREQGLMRVHAFTPSPMSSAAARALAQSVQDLLRSQVLGNGLRLVEVTPPEPGVSNNGLWTIYSTVLSFEFDTTRAHPTPLP